MRADAGLNLAKVNLFTTLLLHYSFKGLFNFVGSARERL